MRVKIDDSFWSPRMELNRKEALIYQWEQYNNCGTVDNFRRAAEKKTGRRRGYFYTDADLHKWADAVSRAIFDSPDEKLEALLNTYIDLMEKAREADGYLYTWNQLYFPGTRWNNLQIEHELFAAGHFIEAGISHLKATGNRCLFDLATGTADLILRNFDKVSYYNCPGHQEIEIALIKLYRVTGRREYLETAGKFLLKRGSGRFFGLHLIHDVISHNIKNTRAARADGMKGPKDSGYNIRENVRSKEPAFLGLRSFFAFISGSYHQQHKSLIKQLEPKGHAVRWSYMMYAAAMYAAETEAPELETLLAGSWENMVYKKMYVTGGIGSLPVIEGFGRNYELDNWFSYSETCASIGSIFWNNEMLGSFRQARYADLIERQLYNAAAVGISQDGKKYFYRNPLESDGSLERRPWFETACCPSNISRLWADIYRLIYTVTGDAVYINQYIGNSAVIGNGGTAVDIKSGFPWEGTVEIRISCNSRQKFNLRIPGWAREWKISVNGNLLTEKCPDDGEHERQSSVHSRAYADIAAGARYEEVVLEPGSGQLIELELPMEITANLSDRRVKGNRGKIAVSRGPLIYCLESEEVISRRIDPGELRFKYDENSFSERSGVLTDGNVSLIPYFLWGNRGKSKMKVWLESADGRG